MTNEIQQRKENPVSTRLDYGDYAGAGFDSTNANDYTLPQLIVLTEKHPHVKKNHRSYVQDAVPGMMYLTGQKRLVDPVKGVIFVCVRKVECYIEQRVYDPKVDEPRYVATHAVDSEVVKAARARAKADPANAKAAYPPLFTPDGHELKQTVYLYGYSLASPDDLQPEAEVVIPIQGTKFDANKQLWDALVGVQRRNGKIPTFAVRFLVGTKIRHGNQDTWIPDFQPMTGEKGASYDVGIMPPKLPSGDWHPLIQFGAQMNEAIKRGEYGVDVSADSDSVDEGAGKAASAGF